MEKQEWQEWEVEIMNGRIIVEGRDIGSANEIAQNPFGYPVDGAMTVAEYIADGGAVFFREDGAMWANE